MNRRQTDEATAKHLGTKAVLHMYTVLQVLCAMELYATENVHLIFVATTLMSYQDALNRIKSQIFSAES